MARPVCRAVVPGLPAVLAGAGFGVGLWGGALSVMAHLVAGMPAFLGFTSITCIALARHVVYGVVADAGAGAGAAAAASTGRAEARAEEVNVTPLDPRGAARHQARTRKERPPMPPTLWQIRLHWLTAALFVAQLALGAGMDTAFEARARGFALPAPSVLLTAAHMATGTALAAAMLARLWLRRRHGAPPVPAARPRRAAVTALWVHRALYAVMLAIPAAGALAWGARSGLAAAAHGALVTAALVLLALHVAGALAEAAWFRTGALARMAGRRGGGGRQV